MAPTTLQEQARAVGDPARHAIFRHIADRERAVGVAELNEQFRFNHNAIRQHLAKLLAAGLITEAQAQPGGRGRPPLLYEVDPAVLGGWDTAGPYERPSRLLLEIIQTGLDPTEVGRRAAAEFRVPAPSGDAVADVSAAMARHGFEPACRARWRGDRVAHLSVRRRRDDRHLGIDEGLADDPHVAVTELVAYDPRSAQCRIRLRVAAEPNEHDAAGALVLRRRAVRR